jgi:type II secretory pathway pseudopilin PulG
MSRQRQGGHTFIEIILAAAMAAIVIAAAVKLYVKIGPAVQATRIRQQASSEARTCMDFIAQRLREGKSSSVSLSTQNNEPTHPNSRIDFTFKSPLASGATAYAFYLSGETAYAWEFTPGVNRAPVVLAHNVTSLSFTAAADDPGLITVGLRVDAPLDPAADASRVVTVIVPPQVVQMQESQ